MTGLPPLPFAPLANLRALGAALLCLASLGEAVGQDRFPPQRDVAEVYKASCAACHGDKLQGATASSLSDRSWKYGASDVDLARFIGVGAADGSQKACAPESDRATVRSLVVYIREQEALAAASTTPPAPPAPGAVIRTAKASFTYEVVTEGLTIPWALAFLPDGSFLVTERPGKLRLIAASGALDPVEIEGIPRAVFYGPEGGLMDVVLHPGHAENGWVYLGFVDSQPVEKGRPPTQTAIVRGRLRDHAWVDQEWIFKARPETYTTSGAHYGMRMAFDGRQLFFSIGERGAKGQAQDMARPNGKVLRVWDDGRVPDDNPFVGVAGAEPALWSLGLRNSQGLVVDPATHAVYAIDHGARGGDEFNQLKRGSNYGWPRVTHGIDYNGRPITPDTELDGMEPPLRAWVPSPALCGLAVYTGTAFAGWQGDFLVGSLKAQELRRLHVEDGRVTEEEIVLKGLGRLRDVRVGPDGLVYILTNDPGRLLRLRPVPEA